MVQSRDDGEKKRPNAAQYSGVKANFMVCGWYLVFTCTVTFFYVLLYMVDF